MLGKNMGSKIIFCRRRSPERIVPIGTPRRQGSKLQSQSGVFEGVFSLRILKLNS